MLHFPKVVGPPRYSRVEAPRLLHITEAPRHVYLAEVYQFGI